jgi:hypothetical protein
LSTRPAFTHSFPIELFLVQVVSAIGIASDGSTGHLVVNAVILAVSIIGFVSLFFTELIYASTFLSLLTILCLWEIVFILVSNLKYGVATNSWLMWDIILCALTGVGSCLLSGLMYGQSGSWMGVGRQTSGGFEYGRGPALSTGTRSTMI